MEYQFQLGQDIDMELVKIEDMDMNLPLLYSDAILWADKSHTQQAIGGAGHRGSGCDIQFRCALDRKLHPKPAAEGGLMPPKKTKVQAKYAQEC